VIKKKIYNNLLEKDEMENLTSEYRVELGKNELKENNVSEGDVARI